MNSTKAALGAPMTNNKRFQELSKGVSRAALGLAIGAAIGAALPASEIEDRLLGPARDNVVHRGQDLASEGVAAVKAAADDVASGVADTLTSHESDQRSLGEKVGQAAQTAAETVAQHVQDAKPH